MSALIYVMMIMSCVQSIDTRDIFIQCVHSHSDYKVIMTGTIQLYLFKLRRRTDVIELLTAIGCASCLIRGHLIIN